MRSPTPGVAALEETAGTWLLDLLGLPADAGGRRSRPARRWPTSSAWRRAGTHVLAGVGWDVEHARAVRRAARARARRRRAARRASTWRCGTSGSARPRSSPPTRQGRIRVDALATALDAVADGEAVIVVLQAGNLHSGAFDPFAELRRRWPTRAARGCTSTARSGCGRRPPRASRQLVAGMADADSWATDAHKTLNVTYDCGIAVGRATGRRCAARSRCTRQLPRGRRPRRTGDPWSESPRCRGGPAGCRCGRRCARSGRSGVARPGRRAGRQRAARWPRASRSVPGAEVLNDVVYTQVCVAFGDDARTARSTERLIADGSAWMSGSRWRDRGVLRVSVSNWSTDESDVEQTVAALRRAAAR